MVIGKIYVFVYGWQASELGRIWLTGGVFTENYCVPFHSTFILAQIYIYIYIYIYLYTHIYIYIYTHTHIYIYNDQHWQIIGWNHRPLWVSPRDHLNKDLFWLGALEIFPVRIPTWNERTPNCRHNPYFMSIKRLVKKRICQGACLYQRWIKVVVVAPDTPRNPAGMYWISSLVGVSYSWYLSCWTVPGTLGSSCPPQKSDADLLILLVLSFHRISFDNKFNFNYLTTVTCMTFGHVAEFSAFSTVQERFLSWFSDFHVMSSCGRCSGCGPSWKTFDVLFLGCEEGNPRNGSVPQSTTRAGNTEFLPMILWRCCISLKTWLWKMIYGN